MFMRKSLLTVIILSVSGSFSSYAECDEDKLVSSNGPGLGKPASEELVKAWDLSIFPDGTGLPIGKGSVAEGAEVFKTDCAICHGPAGIGGTAEELSGGEQGLTGEYPDKTIGTYWPYATTLFDFISRSMPLVAPGSLSHDQTYAVTAYLLNVNKIIAEDAVMSNETLHKVEMPNRDGMEWIYPGLKKTSSAD